MRDEKFESLYKRAKWYATKRGFERDAEDFAQECLIYLFENEIINLEWRFIEYLRKQYGRSGTPSGDTRQLATLRSLSFDAPLDSENQDSASLHSVIGDTKYNPEHLLIDRRPRSFFTGRKGLVYDLWAHHELNQKEIAELLGVSESRVFQLLSPLKIEIQTQKIWDEYKDNENFSKLEIEWIQI